jgi:myo-inositol-1-phosphate synthase
MYNKMDDDLVITGAYNPAEWVKYRDDCEKIKEQYDYLKKNYYILEQKYNEVLKKNDLLKNQFHVELQNALQNSTNKLRIEYKEECLKEIHSQKIKFAEELQQQFQQNINTVENKLLKNQQNLNKCLQQLQRYSTDRFELDALKGSLPPIK